MSTLAERQHGVLSRAQLVSLGFGRGAIDGRLERGLLHPLHRGVYAVGHRLVSTDGRCMAAVLAGGPGAVLSHRSAAALWGIRPSSRARIELTLPRNLRSRDGLEFHVAFLLADEVTRVRGIPVTTVPRTIFDLASVVVGRQVERVMHEAEVKRLTDPLSLSDLLSRYPRHRGAKAIRGVIADRDIGATKTRNDLEEAFLTLIDRAGLPRPRMNEWLHVAGRWIEADCVWHERRLIVELDGRATHATAQAFESDRARDRALSVAGWRVIRVTWRQLHAEPDALVADLRALLSAGTRAGQAAQ